MTGLSIFLVGLVAVSNIGFMVYLLTDRDRKIRHPADNRPEIPEPAQEPERPVPRSLVGKSKFNIDDELESRIDRLVDNAFERNMVRIHDTMLGDVNLRDVEFAQEVRSPAEDASPANVAAPSARNARMTPEQELSAFDDVRIDDVEPGIVSPPSATGVSMEEIEESIETVTDPGATTEQKVKAAKVLDLLADTNLMDGLLSYEQIAEGIKSCMTESLRADIADKAARKEVKAHRSATKKAPSFRIARNIDDFDPADLLK